MLLKDNIPLTYVFGKIKKEVFFVTLYGVGIALLYDNFHVTRLSIPLSVPMILATVLSLLLAFKSNQAYDRWWEARIIWGAIVNDSRTLARQIMTMTNTDYLSDELDIFRERFIKRQIAWSHILGTSLRGLPLNLGYTGIDPAEIEYISRYDNKPAALLEPHARDLNYALGKNGSTHTSR